MRVQCINCCHHLQARLATQLPEHPTARRSHTSAQPIPRSTPLLAALQRSLHWSRHSHIYRLWHYIDDNWVGPLCVLMLTCRRFSMRLFVPVHASRLPYHVMPACPLHPCPPGPPSAAVSALWRPSAQARLLPLATPQPRPPSDSRGHGPSHVQAGRKQGTHV